MSRDSLSIAPQIYILWIFLCNLLGSLNRGLKTVNPPSLNVEICKLSTVKEFSSESTTIFLNYVAVCASKKRQSSKIAYKAVHISYYMTAFKGLLSRTEKPNLTHPKTHSYLGKEFIIFDHIWEILIVLIFEEIWYFWYFCIILPPTPI